MCTPAALETLLRGTLRKVGVDCVAIAVDVSSFIAAGIMDCDDREPITTRLSRAILDGRLVANRSAEGEGMPIDCDEQQPIETILHGLLYPSDPGTNINVIGIWAYVGEAGCPTDCEDDGVGLAERIKGSLVADVGFTPYGLRYVDAGVTPEALDCDDVTPTETLLRSAFVRQADGLWAMRVVLEI